MGKSLKQKLQPLKKHKCQEIYQNVERYRFFFITIKHKENGVLFGLHGMNTINEQEKHEHIFLKLIRHINKKAPLCATPRGYLY